MLFDGLVGQTFKDFELIIIDEWMDERRGIIIEKAEETDIMTTVVKPKKSGGGLCNALNTGLIHAEGELLCPLNDYSWVPQNWLERHWNVYVHLDKKFTVNGYACHHNPPPLAEGKTVEELYYSVFRNPFDSYVLHTSPVTYMETYADRKGLGLCETVHYPTGEKVHFTGLYLSDGRMYYNTMNNSIPLEVMLELNGYDETYDQSGAVLDVDAGVRAEMLGHRFALDVENITHTVEHTEIDRAFGHLWSKYLTFRKPHKENLDYMAKRLDAIKAIARSPNGFSMREERRWARSQ